VPHLRVRPLLIRMSGRHGCVDADDSLIVVDHQTTSSATRRAGPSHRRLAGTIGLGIAVGPIAGGLLLARFWWVSIFIVNVPIAVAASWSSRTGTADSKKPAADRPDPAGALLSIAGLGLLLWAIIEGPTEGWASGDVIGVGLASFAVLGVFVAWEAHSRHPMMKLRSLL